MQRFPRQLEAPSTRSTLGCCLLSGGASFIVSGTNVVDGGLTAT
ncbi:MAG: hypothetical protein R6U94_14865 [Nitriliruptoraceae bacterium]